MDEAYKNKIGERLARTLADALSSGKITTDEASEISTFILDRIDKVQNNSEILALVEEVASKWPAFSGILSQENQQVQQPDTSVQDRVDQEQNAITQAENLIKENKIDEALSVVGNATSHDNQNVGEI